MSQSQGSYVTQGSYETKAIGKISIHAIDNFDGTVLVPPSNPGDPPKWIQLPPNSYILKGFVLQYQWNGASPPSTAPPTAPWIENSQNNPSAAGPSRQDSSTGPTLPFSYKDTICSNCYSLSIPRCRASNKTENRPDTCDACLRRSRTDCDYGVKSLARETNAKVHATFMAQKRRVQAAAEKDKAAIEEYLRRERRREAGSE